MNAAEIREARDGDSQAICDVIKSCFDEYPGCLFELSEMPELIAPRTSARGAHGRMWVAEANGRIGGVVGVAPSERGLFELKKLYVSANLRGRGLGRTLINLVEDFAREHGALGVHLWSDTRFETAHGVYERCGYTRLGATRDLHDVSNSVEYHFEKRFA